MAAGILPVPGSYDEAPCKGACEHRDCAAIKRMAEMDCVYCGKPIGFDKRFYREADPSPTLPEGNLSHAVCAEEAAEAV